MFEVIGAIITYKIGHNILIVISLVDRLGRPTCDFCLLFYKICCKCQLPNNSSFTHELDIATFSVLDQKHTQKNTM